MKKAYIYIGSNNETHRLELNRIKEVISSKFDGFSLAEITGYWKGTEEKTAKVEIIIEDSQELKIVSLCKELKTELSQESILVEFLESNIAFI